MKAIILDRDGVINHDSEDYIKSAEEWQPISDSLEAIARLHKAGYHIFIATNQSGIARGLFDMEALEGIHRKLHTQLGLLGGRITGVFFCPHQPKDHCDCRKPKPGLLQDIAERMNMDLAGVPFVGDSLRDLEAAVAVGARPLLVRTGNGAATADSESLPPDTLIHDDLAAVADTLLKDGSLN